jgi:hypothetical protein
LNPLNFTYRDWMAVIGAFGILSSLLTVLIQWLFCTKRVPRLVLVYRSASIAVFFMNIFTRGLKDDAPPLDINTLLVWANLAFAQFLVMVFTYRRIMKNPEGGRGDRCFYQEPEAE